jgi:uncharacterized protein
MPESTTLPLPGYPEITVERNVPTTMRDGVALYSDIYRPVSSEPLPVILIRIPYDKTQAENVAYAHPSWYARHGYIVVCQDNRGRYASKGTWYPFRHEAEDGLDTIEWAASLPGSNGKVGMYGFSYGGATQLLAAAERPEALTTICPAMTASQYYEGWFYNQGAFATAFAVSWALSLGVNSAQRRGDDVTAAAFATAFASAMNWHWFLPIAEHLALRGEDTSYFFDWLAHPTYDDYWHQWSIDKDYSRLDVPALHVAGWYDIFLSGTIRNFLGMQQHAGSEESRKRQKLIVGPWYHIPWKPIAGQSAETATANIVDDWQVAWFDHILKDKWTGVLDSPVTLFVMGEDRWHNFESWPPPGSTPTPMFLHSGGRANSKYGDGTLSFDEPGSEPVDIFTYDPAIPNQSQGGHSCCFTFVAPIGPADQSGSEEWNGVLVYTSEPLSEDLLLIGDVEAELYASTSAVDTDWTARLCVVTPDGLSTNLQEGIVRARYRDSLTEPTQLEPEKTYRYRIELGPVGVRVAAGNRIRVQISSSDFPQWDRNLNTGSALGSEGLSAAIVATQVVFHNAEHPSHIVLPIVR